MVVVVVGGVWWVSSNKGNLPGYGTQNQANYSSSPSPSSATKPAVKKNTTPISSQNYTELVKQYEGRRIQFDDRCQINPQKPTYKNGTSIMLDNRSAQARAVGIGGVKYDLGAYGYRIVTLSSSSLPKELAVTCGSSGNVGSVLLQAQILQ